MSSKYTTEITCPKCGEKHEFTVWGSINTVVNPEMREKVRDRSVFTFECPTCGYKGLVAFDCLYHQMEDQIMIHLVHSDEVAAEAYKALTDENAPDEYKELQSGKILNRLVRTQNQLLEKLAIFDAGLDDRIVEICKLLTYTRLPEDLREQHGDLDLLFYVGSDGNKYLLAVSDDKPLGDIEFDSALYEDVLDKIGPHLNDIREDDPVINNRWAVDAIKTLTGN